MNHYQSVLSFWFDELKPAQHWQKDDQLDRLITERFASLHQRVAQAEMALWRDTAEGCLAEIIVLDQFSRNIFRDRPESFAYDGMALILSQSAIARGLDVALPVEQRRFVYMPFMHSESLLIHDQAVKLFSQPGLEDNLNFEHRHRDIIKRFGRYPHRNGILSRQSTAEESAFLLQPGSSF